MGSGVTSNKDKSLRGDQLRFFNASSLAQDSCSHSELPHITTLRVLKRRLDSVASFMSHSLGVPLVARSVQLARYAGTAGERYVKHADSGPSNPTRTLTLLLYLNPNWDVSTMGGQLRLWPSGEDGSPVEVEPLMDRLVAFSSATLHEVLPSHAPRSALTVWYHSPDPDAFRHSLADRALRPTIEHWRSVPASPFLYLHPDTTSRIFVSVPAYRDLDVHSTLASLFGRASNPTRVFAGVLYQDAPEDAGMHDPTLIESWKGQVRTRTWHARDAQGPVVARSEVATMWEGEEYYMQIDSHMRFGKHWDLRLLDLIRRCPDPARSVLTTYPPNYEPEAETENRATPSDCVARGPVILYVSKLDDNGMPRVSGRVFTLSNPHAIPPPPLSNLLNGVSGSGDPQRDAQRQYGLLPSRLASAGFVFAPSSILNDVPADPTLRHLFFGEETLWSARAWTRGWDLWTWQPAAWPVRSEPFKLDDLVRHRWSRSYRRTWVGDVKDAGGTDGDNGQWSKERTATHAVVKAVLGMPGGSALDEEHALGGVYGLGTVRSMEDFGSWSAVDFARGQVKALGV
ncbi:glycosyltransferase family 60 protein [Gonapodya prolifera JEL478]|uniref:Glycosyltransferase family 60 protein n=1 Tax=Gonapodya prolifera (strain JEL478) TaxID=1344416 RepID=A0A138ZYQ2_GONPJ|nr:glycosyltransferase family 60 protein [Gonapodya prolifera JEL478]|eukprot:KXS09634.1 glycosyltransferase family 60 protein [Gonapodya prolifera JEL478]